MCIFPCKNRRRGIWPVAPPLAVGCSLEPILKLDPSIGFGSWQWCPWYPFPPLYSDDESDPRPLGPLRAEPWRIRRTGAGDGGRLRRRAWRWSACLGAPRRRSRTWWSSFVWGVVPAMEASFKGGGGADAARAVHGGGAAQGGGEADAAGGGRRREGPLSVTQWERGYVRQ